MSSRSRVSARTIRVLTVPSGRPVRAAISRLRQLVVEPQLQELALERRETAEQIRHEPSVDRGVVRGRLRRLGQGGRIDRPRVTPALLVQRT